MNPLPENPSSSAPLSKPRSLSIKDLILRVVELPGTGKISVSVSLLAVIVTKPKYVLVLYPVTDLSFKRSAKPRVFTLSFFSMKLTNSDKVICMGVLPLHSWKSWISNKTGTSIMIISTFQLIYLKIYSSTLSVFSTLSSLLLDGCEIVHLAGFSFDEKVVIANRVLVPNPIGMDGLKKHYMEMSEETLRDG